MSQITEAKLYEAFGLSEKAQEVAAPAADPHQEDTAKGENVQDPAAPAAEETTTDTASITEHGAGIAQPEEAGNEAVEGAASENIGQTAEQRRANAARRRQQEQQAAIDNAVAAERQKLQQEHDAKLNEVFAKAGLIDSATGKPITNLQEFEQWHRTYSDAKLEQDLKSGKLTKDVLDQLIANHPAVKQAEAAMSRITAAEQERQAEADQARIDDQLAQIAQINPEIKSVADILKMPTAEAFRANVNKGMDFYDAYRLANLEEIAEGKAQRARQAAQANQRGKDHLVSTGNSRGGGAASVPQDQMKLYRMMNPRATDAQIQAHFNHYLTKQGG